MALLSQTQTSPRWEPADTLYSNLAPNQPRVVPIGFSWPVPIGRAAPTDIKTPKPEDKDKEPKLPTAQARPVSTTERLAPLVSQQLSRIPELARHVLPVRYCLPCLVYSCR
jgi:Wiskott-Aldrich syndrome protein